MNESGATTNEIKQIVGEPEPVLAEDSVCGVCGGEVMVSRYTDEPHCIECGQLHELQDVWMFTPHKKPVVVKAWSPVDKESTIIPKDDIESHWRLMNLLMVGVLNGIRETALNNKPL